MHHSHDRLGTWTHAEDTGHSNKRKCISTKWLCTEFSGGPLLCMHQAESQSYTRRHKYNDDLDDDRTM